MDDGARVCFHGLVQVCHTNVSRSTVCICSGCICGGHDTIYLPVYVVVHNTIHLTYGAAGTDKVDGKRLTI